MALNVRKTGGTFKVVFGNMPSQRDERVLFSSAPFSFVVCACLCVFSTLHKYIVHVGARSHLNKWNDGFEQGFLSLLLLLASSSSACHFFISSSICLFIQHTFIPSGLVCGPMIGNDMKGSFHWVEAERHGQTSPSISVLAFILGELISKLLLALISSSWKLPSSNCFGGRKWLLLWWGWQNRD